MILIDLNKPVQDIIVTLTNDLPDEFIGVENPSYILVMVNAFNHKAYQIPLINNLSSNLNRYDHFKVDTNDLPALESGFYPYSIFFLTIQDSNLIETGTIQVSAPVQNNTIIFNEADDSGFIVFNQ